MEKAKVLEKNSLRRWQDDEELGTAKLMPSVNANMRTRDFKCFQLTIDSG